VSEEDIGDIINLNVLEDERLPVPNALIGQYPHDFDLLTPGFSRRSHAGQGSSGHSYSEQALSRGDKFGGDSSLASEAADRAQAAEQAQHGAAAKAALVAAFRLAEEAKGAAKEAEAVAAAKQYHAAHLSSAAQGAQGRAFAEAAFSAKVSKVLHAAEGQEKQARQHAEVLKSAAYAAQSLADQSGYVSEALRHLFSAQKAAAVESSGTAKKLSSQQQEALKKLSLAQAAANKAHAAAAAALANVHKNGIYGGGDSSLFGTTSEEEYEAKISYHTDQQSSFHKGFGYNPDQGHPFRPESGPGTYQSGPGAQKYKKHTGQGQITYEEADLSHYKQGQDLPVFQHELGPVSYPVEQGPANFNPEHNVGNFHPRPVSGVSYPPSEDTSSLYTTSQHGKDPISGQNEISGAASKRFYEQDPSLGTSPQNSRRGQIYSLSEKQQIGPFREEELDEGDIMYGHREEPLREWTIPQNGQGASYGKYEDSSYAFSNSKGILRGGAIYENDGSITYSRQVDNGGNKLHGVPISGGAKQTLTGFAAQLQSQYPQLQDELTGVSMSQMKEKPYIVNGGGSDVVFKKSSNKNLGSSTSFSANDLATKYSSVPEGQDLQEIVQIHGRSGDISLPKAANNQARVSASKSQEHSLDITEGSGKERENSPRLAAQAGKGGGGPGGRRKLRVFKDKNKSSVRASELRIKVKKQKDTHKERKHEEDQVKLADKEKKTIGGKVLDPAVNTR